MNGLGVNKSVPIGCELMGMKILGYPNFLFSGYPKCDKRWPPGVRGMGYPKCDKGCISGKCGGGAILCHNGFTNNNSPLWVNY